MGGPDDEEIPPEDDGPFVEDDARSSDDTGGPDHTGPEDSEGQTEEGLAPPQSRGERHFGKLRSEVRAANERAARLEQTLAELQQRSQQSQQPQQPREETDEEFLARISILGPEQQTREVIGRNNRQRQADLQLHQQELLRTRLQMADQADRNAFQARVASEPILKRVAKDVEDVLRFERQRGRDFDRDTVANYLLGKAWRESAGKVKQAKHTGQENIRRQQARPDAGRSDVLPERRDAARKNLEKRLDGVFI